MTGRVNEAIYNQQREYDSGYGAVVDRTALLGELAQAKRLLKALIGFYLIL